MNEELKEAFPEVEAGIEPFGSYVLVQVRSAKSTTKSGIILHAETKSTEQWNTQVAKVISVGPLAFRNRNTMELWPEGAWCAEGDFVRVAKYGGDRWEVPLNDAGDVALFVIFKDTDLIGKVTIDPLKIRAFI